MFKERFKYLKAKWPVPDFNEVIDVDALTEQTKDLVVPLNLVDNKLDDDTTDLDRLPGLLPLYKWRCYTLPQNPGLILVRNPFTTQGQRYWLARCLRDFPKAPNQVNLNPHLFEKPIIDDWWQALQACSNKDEARRMKIAMRWATLGYHHDWNTKVYDESMCTPFPEDLAQLTACFAKAFNYKDYTAQASIVNYYPLGTTLCGHTDKSEADLEAPLFSFSFGQTAIFLIGGLSIEEKASAIFLKNGDVLVMSKESRLCYHAVPRVMKAQDEGWNDAVPSGREQSLEPPKPKRIKIDEDFIFQDDDDAEQQRHHQASAESTIDMKLYKQVADENFWQPFRIYLNDSRVNINVRQVLKPGMTSLS